MDQQPKIKRKGKTYLVGKKLLMSVADNKTQELWKSFMPLRGEVNNRVDKDFYSVEVYSGLDYFKRLDTTKEFQKWAAVRVDDHESIPKSMEGFIIPDGDYAVFLYQGSSVKAHNFYQYIFTEWLPKSENELDDRPHFAVMGENYKNNDPDSQEEIWIPIKY